jgi:hypothetical protein
MRHKVTISILGATAVAAVLAFAAMGGTSSPTSGAAPDHSMHAPMKAKTTVTASDLRALLGKQFGEHAALAMNATNAGYSSSKSFTSIAAALDKNSVAISKSIGSVYGAAAAKTFLDGKFMWRDHVRFFVDYTVALGKKDKAGQAKAVANLQTYTVRFGDFLAGATGLPKLAVRNDLLGHILELKAQLDAYAKGQYGKAATLYRNAYDHMFMTADLVAGAIAKQKGLS